MGPGLRRGDARDDERRDGGDREQRADPPDQPHM
jgi:hypothetical protein